MSQSLTVTEFQEHLVGKPAGLVIDIDETLSATNVAWFDRLVDLFGMPPEGLSTSELIAKYSLAQNVSHWNAQPAAHEWMQAQRDSLDAQKGLPLIPGAKAGMKELAGVVPVLGYLTVRPVSVVEPTLEWLKEEGFPLAPVVAKPSDVPFAEGNQWKGKVLNQLVASGVTGIVDDNPKVSRFAGKEYPGTLFLFGKPSCPEGTEHAIPCETWSDVVDAVKARKEKLNKPAINTGTSSSSS